jgi:hypothetical protein
MHGFGEQRGRARDQPGSELRGSNCDVRRKRHGDAATAARVGGGAPSRRVEIVGGMSL